jgi:phosphoserine aminotransferase
MGEQIYNFSAGPATMPHEVNLQAAEDQVDYLDMGMGIGELSHRGDEFQVIAAESEADLRELMDIPDDYAVLFLPGGAQTQFASVPQNLARRTDTADYALTGYWSEKAAKAGAKLLGKTFGREASTVVPPVAVLPEAFESSDGGAYYHVTPNETIDGVAFSELPETDAPIVADMSSVILSRPVRVDEFGVIYASSQKNMGPAGLTVVIVDRDLLGKARTEMPNVQNWDLQAEAGSMVNTPPTETWHKVGLVLKWLKQQGGLEAMAEVNERKASKLYAAIDESILFSNPVVPEFRSRMNVPFIMTRAGLDARFLYEADQEGLVNLEGHRSVGGMRASIYNAMPEAGVDALISFMRDFEEKNS